jgi:molybdate/tungstate transport system ATP-binding protein
VIEVNKLFVKSGQFQLANISFAVPQGEYAALMGKTGCGKTTLVEAIMGLRRVNGGKIYVNDVDVTRFKPAQREIGFVPQDGALFQSMTVRHQIALALYIRKFPADIVKQRVDELAGLLQIQKLLDRYPEGLSGGERQRVALGRALSFWPKVLCLDEPLSALDSETRQQMFELLKEVRAHTGVTALHVTHNRDEAEALADRVLQFEDGEVVEISW